MQLPITLESVLQERCAQNALASLQGQSFGTLDAIKAELDKQYKIQLVSCIDAPTRRTVVGTAIQSALSSDQQEAISDATVELTLRDLVLAGVVELVVTWS